MEVEEKVIDVIYIYIYIYIYEFLLTLLMYFKIMRAPLNQRNNIYTIGSESLDYISIKTNIFNLSLTSFVA